MNIFKLAFSIYLLISTSIYGVELTNSQISDIRSIIEELTSSSHTILKEKEVNISIHTIDNPTYYFESNFTMGRFLFGKKNYRVGVNPIVFEKNIPYDALVGVLAHELCHTEDYATGSTIGRIIPIGFQMIRRKSRAKYERRTDLKLVKKGHAMNMKAYRLWQYPMLSKVDLARKKKEYLTPEEFDFVESVRKENPELLNKWVDNPPKNLGEFKRDYESISESVRP